MMLTDIHGRLAVEWKGGTGVVVGYTSRGRTKKIVAIVVSGRKLYDVPIGEISVIRSPKKRKS